jgi:hypothetical protein
MPLHLLYDITHHSLMKSYSLMLGYRLNKLIIDLLFGIKPRISILCNMSIATLEIMKTVINSVICDVTESLLMGLKDVLGSFRARFG